MKPFGRALEILKIKKGGPSAARMEQAVGKKAEAGPERMGGRESLMSLMGNGDALCAKQFKGLSAAQAAEEARAVIDIISPTSGFREFQELLQYSLQAIDWAEHPDTKAMYGAIATELVNRGVKVDREA